VSRLIVVRLAIRRSHADFFNKIGAFQKSMWAATMSEFRLLSDSMVTAAYFVS